MTSPLRTDADPASDATAAVALLHTTEAVRTRADVLLDRARRGQSRWFTVDDAALETAADAVADVTVARYPDLRVPFHSRWRHFEAGERDRPAWLAAQLDASDAPERARSWIDLTVVSVLLDAGAGARWHYDEPDSGMRFTRSEGLGVASWHAFCAGLFSSDPAQPLRVDAAGLRGVTVQRLADVFQVSRDNPLVGLDGRAALLRRLADVLDDGILASPQGPSRPGTLYDAVLGSNAVRSNAVVGGAGAAVNAHDILTAVLAGFGPIWPAANTISGLPLGDCWRHPGVDGPGLTAGWVPFHKLSQWLTYSLLEPFGWAGVEVRGLDQLTALPEYRNGGLLLDTAVLRLRDDTVAGRTWAVHDELVVEWRALTVALLDRLAPLVCARLGVDEAAFPLACVLEGGTWAAGRELAAQRRGGLPPLTISSDGTVF